jgi:hypothetical protein
MPSQSVLYKISFDGINSYRNKSISEHQRDKAYSYYPDITNMFPGIAFANM